MDPQDTDEVMDMASAGHTRVSQMLRDRLKHTITTHEDWTNPEFQGAEFRFWLPDGDAGFDRSLYLDFNQDGSLRGSMLSQKGTFFGYANVYRSDDRSLAAEFPVRLLKKGTQRYRWKAFLWPNPCPDDGGGTEPSCIPPKPDTHEGRVLHEL